MAWIPIVEVGITLNTAGSIREGFGLPLFITATDKFPERVRGYASIDDVAVDFAETDPAYKAALALWSQTPRVSQLYIGRRNLQYVTNVISTPADADVFEITLSGAGGTSQTFRHVVSGSAETAHDIFTGLKTAIEADPNFSNVSRVTLAGTDAQTSMLVDVADAEMGFVKVTVPNSSVAKLNTTANVSDSLGTALDKIEKYNDEFYFVTADDRTTNGVEALAKEVEARKKIYFTAISDPDSLNGTNITGATDVGAYLASHKFSRTAVLWHQTAPDDFPELAYVAYGAPYDAGSISWGNALLTGQDYSRQPSNKRPLNTAQKSALEARNVNYIDFEGGQNVVRHGKVVSGEWIDIIRGVDWLQSELTADLRDLLINQKGGKVTYDETGITRVRQVIETTLQRAVNRRFLETFKVDMPRYLDVSIADKRARLLKDVKFTGILAGAINDVNLQGSVSYE